MRKVKLLAVLLAVVMVLPMIAGLGMKVSADDIDLHNKLLLVYPKNPADRNTLMSMKLPELTDYADGAILTEASESEMRTLASKNIEYTSIGNANLSLVNGIKLGAKEKNLEVLDPPRGWYGVYADETYEGFDFAYYLVQFVGPLKRGWINKINNMGGYVMDSYPVANQTYLVRMNKENASDLKGLDWVRGICLHTPIFKTTLWPKDKDSVYRVAVSLTIAGNLPFSELEEVRDTLKGFGCKTFLASKMDNFYDNQEDPARPEGMSDEEYDKMIEEFHNAREQEKEYYETVIDDNGTKIKDIARTIIFGTIGSTHPEGMPDEFDGPYEAAFARVVCPMHAIAEIAGIPQVLNIDMFAEPEAQNDLATWQIGANAAWSANESTAIVTDPTDTLPHDRLDHFGLHGESFLPTSCYLETVNQYTSVNDNHHYRQIVAVVGTGLSTGDVSSTYSISTQYSSSPVGDFAGRVVDHLSYVRKTFSLYNTNRDTKWRWPPTNGSGTRVYRGHWTSLSFYHPDTWTSGLVGSRSQPWMDWDGHDTHVTGSGFGDGWWSTGQTPDDDWGTNGREPFDTADTTATVDGYPGTPHMSPNLDAPYQTAPPPASWDYRGVAYRAGIVVQRVTNNNFTIPYEYGRGQAGDRTYYYHWHYAGRPTYMGLYQSPTPLNYLVAPDSMFSIVNDAYVVGARIQVNAWVVPHRGMSNSFNYPLSPGDREITYDPAVLNANEYNFFCTQMDRFTWEQKDMLLVQAGTTNTRYAAPFIYDYEYYNYQDSGYPQRPGNANPAVNRWRYGNGYYSSPWCYTTPPTHEWERGITYPVATPAVGVYYPPIGDTSTNTPAEFNYYYHQTTQSTQPPTMDQGTWPPGNADGKTDFATSALSPATAKNVITVGASESYRNIQTIRTVMPDEPTTVLPLQWTARGPWTYGNAYGGWFPLPPLFTDNTANSDSPYDTDVDGNTIYESDWWDTNNYGGTFAIRPPTTITTGYGQVAAFSGRGPTPDLDYSHGDATPQDWEPAGRYKPDIVAPGTQIMSTASYLTLMEIGYWDPQSTNTESDWTGNEFNGQRQVNGDNYEEGGPYIGRHPSLVSPSGRGDGEMYKHYALMEGTSCATGFVAGAAAVTRQYYENRGLYNYPNPSSALIKSTLIHGARNLGGHPGYDIDEPGAGYTAWDWLSAKPSYSQGFGRLDIKRSLYPDPPTYMLYEDHESGITTGEKHYYYYDVDDNSVPFEATLVYTDMPKLPNPQVALANDLDLIVIDPGGTEYHGNIYATDPHIDQHTNMYASWGRVSRANPGGTEFDRRNNVERVVIPPNQIVEGRWTVTISGARVEQSSTNIPQLYAFNVSAGNLTAAVAPAPEVPALSSTAIILVILGLLGVGAFFIIREKAVSEA